MTDQTAVPTPDSGPYAPLPPVRLPADHPLLDTSGFTDVLALAEAGQGAPHPEDDPVWRRLVLDASAFQRAYPTPAHLAELLVQAVSAGAAHGIQRVQLSATTRPAPPTPMQLVAEILDGAARRPGDPGSAALYAFAHASQRARAAVVRTVPAAVATDGGDCDG